MAHKLLTQGTHPLVLDGPTPLDLLALIAQHPAPDSILLVCAEQSAFTALISAHAASARRPASAPDPSIRPPPDPSTDPTVDPSTNPPPDQASRPPPHPLLHRTLHALSAAPTSKVVFCPSHPHTLAYLALLAARPPPPREQRNTPGPAPLLLVFGPVAQAREAGRCSAQGLGRVLGGAVAAGRRWGGRVVVYEPPALCEPWMGGEGLDGGGGGQGTARDASIWDDEVGVLGSAKRAYAADEGWRGRRVSLRRVASRWCEVVRVDAGV